MSEVYKSMVGCWTYWYLSGYCDSQWSTFKNDNIPGFIVYMLKGRGRKSPGSDLCHAISAFGCRICTSFSSDSYCSYIITACSSIPFDKNPGVCLNEISLYTLPLGAYTTLSL